MAKANRTDTLTVAQGGTICVALELSQESWLVALRELGESKLSRHKLAVGDVAGLLRAIERARRGRSMRVVSCYEAGADGFWLHRRLLAAGIENLVIDPASLLVDRRARRRKTDRLDLEAMLRALLAYLQGDRDALRVVAVPSVELEDARRVERERGRLVKERIAHANRMRSLLATLGIAAKDDGGRFAAAGWPDWLAAQRQWDGRPVPAQLTAELKREHERLRLIERQLSELARTQPALPKEQALQAQRLASLRGIGPAISTGYAGEVLWHGFTNRRQVGRYLGLDPSPWRSGGVVHEQGIGRAGNRRARTLLVEAAWLWLVHQPDNALSRWFRAKTASASGRLRRIVLAGLARKLAVLLWRIATTGVVPADVRRKPAAARA